MLESAKTHIDMPNEIDMPNVHKRQVVSICFWGIHHGPTMQSMSPRLVSVLCLLRKKHFFYFQYIYFSMNSHPRPISVSRISSCRVYKKISCANDDGWDRDYSSGGKIIHPPKTPSNRALPHGWYGQQVPQEYKMNGSEHT